MHLKHKWLINPDLQGHTIIASSYNNFRSWTKAVSKMGKINKKVVVMHSNRIKIHSVLLKKKKKKPQEICLNGD